MRSKKSSALLSPSILLGVASHTVMGIALGLGFAFVLTHITALGIVALINLSAAPENTQMMLVLTCVTMFGIGATFTGIALMTMKDKE
jgi:hypothetical protein